jgi:uncharacterized membrane protein HdeD (DUF308 family)
MRWTSLCGMLGGVGKGNLSGPMTQRDSLLFKSGWISLAIVGIAILLFGLLSALMPASSGLPYLRAIGVASIGMGLFGLLITTIAYRRRERWAWFSLWYYPVFWTWHLVGGLPPGKDHVHQVVIIVLSLAGLLLPVREFFPRRGHGNSRPPDVPDRCELRRTP